jgi:hypothetical protein
MGSFRSFAFFMTVSVKVSPKGTVSPQLVEETKTVLKELGLSQDVRTD